MIEEGMDPYGSIPFYSSLVKGTVWCNTSHGVE